MFPSTFTKPLPNTKTLIFTWASMNIVKNIFKPKFVWALSNTFKCRSYIHDYKNKDKIKHKFFVIREKCELNREFKNCLNLTLPTVLFMDWWNIVITLSMYVPINYATYTNEQLLPHVRTICIFHKRICNFFPILNHLYFFGS